MELLKKSKKALRIVNINYITIICGFSIIVSCDPGSNNKEEKISISLIDSYNLNVSEPSGLTYNKNMGCLYFVSDKPDGQIYSINSEGELIDSLPYDGDDLEAITYNNETSILWLSEESLLQLVKLDHSGNELDRIELDFIPYDFQEKRIEGLCINQKNNSLYLLNEKNPGALIEMDIVSLLIKNIYYLNFASDYSAIEFIDSEDLFVILSDENKSAYFWNIEDGLINTFDLGYYKGEGVAVDKDKLFIVSEQENKLYKYIFK